MKNKLLPLLTLPLTLVFSSCASAPSYDIVVTMYPQYDIAKAIVADKMSVHSILSPGVEVHDFEASSTDIVAMNKAKLVIYTSPIIDTWMNETALENDETIIIDLSSYYHEDEDVHIEDDHEHEHEHDQIHYWVDPLAIVDLTEVVLEQIVAIDPDNASFYQSNAASYVAELNSTYTDFMAYLDNNDLHESTLYFAGHNAMGLFGARHHLDIHGLFEDFKPDEDLGSQQLIEFTNAVREAGTSYLFVEEMIVPKAATTIKNELARTGYELTLLELHAYHNVSQIDFDSGLSYIDLYERNIANIKLALA
jgi:zinc transport system substrate-binding protein